MKKITTVFAVILMASVALTSCSSKKSDAKKMGEVYCKMQSLLKTGDYTSDDYTKAAKEFQDLNTKSQEKYKGDVEFATMLLKEYTNCK
jgi:hypothetical protein